MHLKNEELRPLPHFIKQLRSMEKRISKRLLSIYKIPKKELEVRQNIWSAPTGIDSKAIRDLFYEHFADSDDTILVNTFLNSQSSGTDNYYDEGYREEVKRKKEVRLTWLGK